MTSAAIEPTPGTAAMLTAVALLAAAIGPWLPERVLGTLARFLERRRSAGRIADRPPADPSSPAGDHEGALFYLSIALVCCTAGVVALATLALADPWHRAHEFLLARFFWTNLTLTALDWGWVAVSAGPSWIMLGLLYAMLCLVPHPRPTAGRHISEVAPGFLVGVGFALWAGEQARQGAVSCEQVFLLGVLGMFLMAGVAAYRVQSSTRPAPPAGDDLPEVAPEGESVIWMSIVLWGAAASLLTIGWSSSFCRAEHAQSAGTVSLFCLAVAAGYVATSLSPRTPGVNGCGMATWAAGIISALAITVTSLRPENSHLPSGILIGAALGYALHQAETAWLQRVGSEAAGFAQLASALLTGAAIGLITGAWIAVPRLGAMGAAVAGALLMMGFGGLVQIYEKNCPVTVRHRRLAVIFASLAGAILVLPSDVQRWTQWEQLTAPRSSVRRVGLNGLLPGVVGPVCVIDTQLTRVQVDTRSASAERIPFGPFCRTSLAVPSRFSAHSAMRRLRLGHRRYALIYQRVPLAVGMLDDAQYSREWLEILRSHTSSGGHVVVDVDLATCDVEAIRVIAGTFRNAMNPSALWRIETSDRREAILRLLCMPGSHASDLSAGWQSVDALLDGADPGEHSLRRSRLAGHARPEDTAIALRFLEACSAPIATADAVQRQVVRSPVR